ncbi:MAG: phosphotransferase family protein [Chloroflexi bacterium]|nr:phosphotransferase family protein [Chloroflexota bacterium]
MSDQKQILERYLKAKFSDKTALSITRVNKLADGWESDNHFLTVEYGDMPRTREDWVWRIYSGAGSQEKAAREFQSMKKLHDAGYPVPSVFLLETGHSLFDRPFIIMEFIPGEMMWNLLDNASVDEQERLIDQFCRLFVRLHSLDWKQFDDSLPDDDPFFFIDRWLAEARGGLQNFPEVDVSPFLEWVEARRDLFACARPSPVHQDFHPLNILVKADGSAAVIDWTGYNVTDPRFDLAWTLVLAHAHGSPAWRGQIFNGYQRHAEKPVEHIEAFEALACARRLFDLTISLTYGAERLGMNDKAVESMRSYMDGHKRVHRLFVERTRLQIDIFDKLFGESG